MFSASDGGSPLINFMRIKQGQLSSKCEAWKSGKHIIIDERRNTKQTGEERWKIEDVPMK